MYLIFKSVNSEKLGIIQTIGRVLNYCVGYVPDTHVDLAEYQHLNPTVVEEEIALCWKFFGSYSNQISVRPGTLQNEQLQVISSSEADGQKVKYTMSQQEIDNTVKFMQYIMYKMLDEFYDKRFTQINLTASVLEQSTWAQQRYEAEIYILDNTKEVPLLNALASSRNISVGEMANKIISAINNYNQSTTDLLSRKQIVKEEIKMCSTIADCNRLLHNRFEYHMPVKQMKDENVTTGSLFNI